MTEALRVGKLRREHDLDSFDCGQEPLNRFLVRYALQSQQAEASQTYVALANDEVVGFYTLVVAQVEYDDAPSRLAKGLAKHPIPLMLLARLAIATSWQGKRLGAGLLKVADITLALEELKQESESGRLSGQVGAATAVRPPASAAPKKTSRTNGHGVIVTGSCSPPL